MLLYAVIGLGEPLPFAPVLPGFEKKRKLVFQTPANYMFDRFLPVRIRLGEFKPVSTPQKVGKEGEML
jgi:hypothetical protein